MFNKFPFRVTVLLCLVLLFTAWNILRAWTGLSWHASLSKLATEPSSVIIISGFIWSFTGIFLIWGIWQKKAWAKKLLLGAIAGYTVWYWSERFVWQMPRPNWPFAVILNLVLVLFIIFTTNSTSREAHERKS